MFNKHSPAGSQEGLIGKSGKSLLLGVAGGLAAVALLAKTRRTRRREDYDAERRNPLHFFLANKDAHRRRIDQSGKRPLFERRQSVYEKY